MLHLLERDRHVRTSMRGSPYFLSQNSTRHSSPSIDDGRVPSIVAGFVTIRLSKLAAQGSEG
jgi:hypothetical protein